jgi:hypothetical protein
MRAEEHLEKHLEKSFTAIGWFLLQGNKKSQNLASVAFFFSRCLSKVQDLSVVMGSLSPVYERLQSFCRNEMNSHKGGVINFPTGLEMTEKEEMENLKRFKSLVAGVDSEGCRRMIVLMESLYSADFLIEIPGFERGNNFSEGYVMAWILYLLIFDEASLETILPIISRLDSEMESPFTKI